MKYFGETKAGIVPNISSLSQTENETRWNPTRSWICLKCFFTDSTIVNHHPTTIWGICLVLFFEAPFPSKSKQIESCFGGETALDPFFLSSDTLQVALINQIWSWMEYLQVLTSRKVNIAIENKPSPSNLAAVIFQGLC